VPQLQNQCSSLERQLQERNAEITTLQGRLEAESRQVQKLSAALKERSIVQSDADSHTVVSSGVSDKEAALEGFARALAAAQQQVLEQQLHALRSGNIGDAGWVQASAEWDDDDIGWGSDAEGNGS